jgi:ubiquinone/menaquinone biosynthesis C-methylase UbiE
MGVALLLGALGAALVVWELWICEGAHLGRGFVVWLYNLAAPRYDRIKRFRPSWESRFLGEPIASVVGGLEGALLLDVGAGTGRLARAALPLDRFHGAIVSLEPSPRMLRLGRGLTSGGRNAWVRAWAVPLPFGRESFDMAVSLEMLEFTPHPRQTLTEMVRVLRPGGWLLVTNRVGAQARWILGRTFPRERFPEVLAGLGLEDVETYRWQIDYDLVWARKPARA